MPKGAGPRSRRPPGPEGDLSPSIDRSGTTQGAQLNYQTGTSRQQGQTSYWNIESTGEEHGRVR